MSNMNDEQRARFAAALRGVGKDLIDFAKRVEKEANPEWNGSWLGLECQGHICNELGITKANPRGSFGDSMPE